MIAVPESLPDDPILLKHLLLLASEQAAAKDARIEQLQEQVALLRHKLFSPKSERSPEDADADSTPFGHSAHADPDTCSTLIRTGSRSAATQGWHC